jgi:hypothetical protein
MENLMRLKHLVSKEIGEIADLKTLTPEVLDSAIKIVCLYNEIGDAESKINGWDDGMSRRSYRDSYMDDYSGLRMRSPMTGRYISTRDNYNDGRSENYRDDSYRDGYTNHSKDDLIMDLEMKARNAKTDRERNSIMDTIEIIKRQQMS